MTLTGTLGYMLHSEFNAYYDYQDTSEVSVLGFNILTRPQPDNYRTDDENGYRQGVLIKYDDAGATARFRYNGLNFKPANVFYSLDSASAQTGWGSDSTDEKTNGNSIGLDVHGINAQIAESTFTSYYTGTATYKTCAISALYLERIPDTACDLQIETTGCHISGGGSTEWTPHNENESASSFLLKEIALNNTLTVNGATTEGRTYPIIRAHGA